MPIQTRLSNLMPIQIRLRIRILPQVLHMLANPQKIFSFTQSSASIHCLVFLVSVIGVIFLNNLDMSFEVFWKKYSLALYIWLKWIRIKLRIWIHNTGTGIDLNLVQDSLIHSTHENLLR
jgi:hypothetical protein